MAKSPFLRFMASSVLLVLGIFALFIAAFTFQNHIWLGAVSALALASVLLPTWTLIVRRRWPNAGAGARWSAGALLFITTMLTTGTQIERVNERERERRATAFAEAKDSIFLALNTALTSGEYQAVTEAVAQWADIGNDSLASLGKAAQQAIEAKDRAVRIDSLLAKAGDVSPTDIEANLRIYSELSNLDPENARFEALSRRFASLVSERDQNQRKESEAAARREMLAARREMLATKWTYNSSTDEMSGRVSRQASIRSENTVNFDFPYQGPQHAGLTLRIHPSYGREVIFRIERGQILCASYSRCRLMVRFDAGPAQSWGASEAADGSSEIIFLRDYDTFVSRMRRAQVVRIQPEIYQEGAPVFEFHVGGYNHAR